MSDQTPENPETPDSAQDDELRPAIDPTLRGAVLELEQHAAAAGWDQPAQLFALVPAGDLVGSAVVICPNTMYGWSGTAPTASWPV